MRFVILLAMVIGLGGCATTLPRHEWVDAPTAIQIMRARGEHIRSISSACTVILRSADASVRLDGALAAEPPERFRVRGWKFGTPVVDLTATTDGVWLMISDRAPPETTNALDLITHARLSRAWDILSGRALAPGIVEDSGGTRLHIAGDDFNAEIDRSTLTIRAITFSDGEAGVVALERYTLLADGTPWPMRIRAEHPEGSIEVRLHDPVLNEALDPAAFRPPRQAVPRP